MISIYFKKIYDRPNPAMPKKIEIQDNTDTTVVSFWPQHDQHIIGKGDEVEIFDVKVKHAVFGYIARIACKGNMSWHMMENAYC